MGTVRLYSEEPIETKLILDTFKASFGIELDQKAWEWRFLNNPDASHPYIAYIVEDGVLAAYYAVSPVKINVDGESKHVALSNMTMTHPNYRGQGYFKLLADTLFKKLKMDGFLGVFGFANHNSHYGFRKHLGWKDLSALNMFQVTSDAYRPIKKEIDGLDFQIVDVTDEYLEKTNKLICSSNAIQLTRDIAVLKWRFTQNPTQNYQILIGSQNGEVLSMIVFKRYNSEIDIMEYFYKSECDPIETLLVSFNFLVAQTKATINLWSNLHSNEHLFLEKHGFQETSFNSYFGVVPLNGEEITEYSKWHYRFMDSDIF